MPCLQRAAGKLPGSASNAGAHRGSLFELIDKAVVLHMGIDDRCHARMLKLERIANEIKETDLRLQPLGRQAHWQLASLRKRHRLLLSHLERQGYGDYQQITGEVRRRQRLMRDVYAASCQIPSLSAAS